MRLRAPSLDDAPAVLAVLEARDLTDLGVVEHRLADLLDEWRSSSFDLEADAIVAEADAGEVVAYATVQRPGTLVAVAPEHEREGIGTCLLAWAEQRERALGRARHRQWVAAYNARGHALLRGAGYQRIRSYWRLTRRLDGPVSPSAPPAGVALRPLSVGRDAVALHEVSEASFAANADYEPEPFGAFREKHLEAHDLDPGLSWVAERGALVAGFVLARRWAGEGTGYVDILAVHPAEQRCGLGTSLLTHAFVGFADAGLGEAQLGVASDNPRALRLYERAGMTQKFQVDTLERPATVAELSEKSMTDPDHGGLLAETRAFNAELERLLATSPSVEQLPAEVTRRARREGRGIFPAPGVPSGGASDRNRGPGRSPPPADHRARGQADQHVPASPRRRLDAR